MKSHFIGLHIIDECRKCDYLKSRGFNRHRFTALMVVVSLLLITLSLQPFNSLVLEVRAEGTAGYGLSNPVMDSNGIATWDCVYFGNYAQSDATGVKKEPIKWRVLSVSGDDAFLLADQCLDIAQYNATREDVTWETSAIRAWLNKDFMNDAFTAEEQSALIQTNVVNDDNADGGNNTQDKVYLLSDNEAYNNAYGLRSSYNTPGTLRAHASAYAKEKGAFCFEVDGKEVVSWWLRSPGYRSSGNPGGVAVVLYFGQVYLYSFTRGYYADERLSVRPVLHINLSSTGLWSNAGKVTSDGNVIPAPTASPAPSAEPIATPSPTPTASPTTTPDTAGKSGVLKPGKASFVSIKNSSLGKLVIKVKKSGNGDAYE